MESFNLHFSQTYRLVILPFPQGKSIDTTLPTHKVKVLENGITVRVFAI